MCDGHWSIYTWSRDCYKIRPTSVEVNIHARHRYSRYCKRNQSYSIGAGALSQDETKRAQISLNLGRLVVYLRYLFLVLFHPCEGAMCPSSDVLVLT